MEIPVMAETMDMDRADWNPVRYSTADEVQLWAVVLDQRCSDQVGLSPRGHK